MILLDGAWGDLPSLASPRFTISGFTVGGICFVIGKVLTPTRPADEWMTAEWCPPGWVTVFLGAWWIACALYGYTAGLT